MLKIKSDIGDGEKAERLEKCLDGVLNDIRIIKQEGSMIPYPASTIDEKTWSDKWQWGENWPEE